MNLNKAFSYMLELIEQGVDYTEAENKAATKYHVDPIRLMEKFDNTDFI